MSNLKTLRLAVCLFPDVTALDYEGPVELLGFISPKNAKTRDIPKTCPYLIDITYLSHTMEPVEPSSGPNILPTQTYNDVKDDEQFDIILVPGGRGARPGNIPEVILDFIKRQAPRAMYILSVCTGSWVLAGCGLLDGKRATTNKFSFAQTKAATSDKINWVPKARWVVDGNIWTSSGVTAGMDMTNAFLTHLVGNETATMIRNIIELRVVDQDDDEFAAVHGLS